MKPARSFLDKDSLPIHFTGLQLRNGGVPAVGAPESRAHAKSTFRKVQSIAHRVADAIVRYPANVVRSHSALQDEIFHQPADRIIGERSDDSRFQTEASPQSAGHVVLATAFPGVKMARSGNPFFAGIKAQHHFAQTDQVPHGSLFWFYLHGVLINSLSADFKWTSDESSRLSGSTNNQAAAPPKQSAAATKKGAFQPSREAIQGVSEAVIMPPIWLPIFIKPETDPEEAPPISAETDQN